MSQEFIVRRDRHRMSGQEANHVKCNAEGRCGEDIGQKVTASCFDADLELVISLL